MRETLERVILDCQLNVKMLMHQANFLGVVVIPALNEATVVAELIHRISDVTRLDIILVNDHSDDGTASIARTAGAMVIDLPIRMGAWTATQTGLRAARRLGYDFAITMDADGQHDPADALKLAAEVLYGDADVALGSCTARGSPLRDICWRMLRHASGLVCNDLISGYRALNREAMEVLCSEETTNLDYQDVGILLMLERAGLKVTEVPARMEPRKNGKSRIFHSWFTVGRYVVETLLLSMVKRNHLRVRRPVAL